MVWSIAEIEQMADDYESNYLPTESCLSVSELGDEGALLRLNIRHLTVKCPSAGIVYTSEWDSVLKKIQRYTKCKVIKCVKEFGKQNQPHIHLVASFPKKVNCANLACYLYRNFNEKFTIHMTDKLERKRDIYHIIYNYMTKELERSVYFNDE